jgi:hypothetical protein
MLDREENDKMGIKMTPTQRATLMQNLMASHGTPYLDLIGCLASLTVALAAGVVGPTPTPPPSSMSVVTSRSCLLNPILPTFTQRTLHLFLSCHFVLFSLLATSANAIHLLLQFRSPPPQPSNHHSKCLHPPPSVCRICSTQPRKQQPQMEECSRYGPVLHIYVDPIDPKVLSINLCCDTRQRALIGGWFDRVWSISSMTRSPRPLWRAAA